MHGYNAEIKKAAQSGAALMLGAALVSVFIAGGGRFTGSAPMLMGAHWFYVIQLAAFPVLGAFAGTVCADNRKALETVNIAGYCAFAAWP